MTHLWRFKDWGKTSRSRFSVIFTDTWMYMNKSFPVCLQAYGLCKTDREKLSLLSDLLIRRGEGVTSTTRRVGPELSKRLFLMMSSCDPELTLDSTVWPMIRSRLLIVSNPVPNSFGLWLCIIVWNSIDRTDFNVVFIFNILMYRLKFYVSIILKVITELSFPRKMESHILLPGFFGGS